MHTTLNNIYSVHLSKKLYGYPPAFDRKMDKIRLKKKASRKRPTIANIRLFPTLFLDDDPPS